MERITENCSQSISYLRVCAVIMIVTCHILQAYNNQWAWVINVGVQIFFFLSGFLYGHKMVGNVKTWYTKRFTRIYIPYVVYLFFALPFYYYFHEDSITLKNVVCYAVNLQGVGGTISGLGHLWFLSIIMVCYAITPPLRKSSVKAFHYSSE